MLQIKHYRLPHTGIIPGARGHKKIEVAAGTKVYCIVYGTKIFWCAYLTEKSAVKCMSGLIETTNPTARRHIDLETLIAWNFKDAIPKRIHREKAK